MSKPPAKPSNRNHEDAPPQFCVGYGQLTEEQKKWPVLRLTDGGRLVRVDAPDPPPHSADVLLAAVGEMLRLGFAGDAEAIFRHLRNAKLTLKAEVGDDGVLRVTTAPA